MWACCTLNHRWCGEEVWREINVTHTSQRTNFTLFSSHGSLETKSGLLDRRAAEWRPDSIEDAPSKWAKSVRVEHSASGMVQKFGEGVSAQFLTRHLTKIQKYDFSPTIIL
ncbi:hypothetical protein AVEN_5776-1 [Araneus ventricosus]|uniref:Uncharacterized protein n=1 Tax=Araneus ventricosus TaxID=182803 RepID=A0A4Y2DVY7_ARAVE|nr:hypothetical protein AVEN_5776-1 [Araneus ventricosus]